jgi:hypothetical protein
VSDRDAALWYRAELLDLIAKLQDPATGYRSDCDGPWPRCGDAPGGACSVHYENAVEHAADRAEQRLREVQGE